MISFVKVLPKVVTIILPLWQGLGMPQCILYTYIYIHIFMQGTLRQSHLVSQFQAWPDSIQ